MAQTPYSLQKRIEKDAKKNTGYVYNDDQCTQAHKYKLTPGFSHKIQIFRGIHPACFIKLIPK